MAVALNSQHVAMQSELLTMATSIIGFENTVASVNQTVGGCDLFAIDRKKVTIYVIDDEPINVDVVAAYLEEAGYENIVTFTDSTRALSELQKNGSDVVLLDLMMPKLSGLDLLKLMREDSNLCHIPTIVLTASTERTLKSNALELGAADFLNKPFDAEELLARTHNALIRKAHFDYLQNYASVLEQVVQQRTAELVRSQIQLVQCLGRAAEYRDNDTGMHVIRVGRYSGIIAHQLGLPLPEVQQIELAATLHDVGKLGVPDAILLKKGRLDPDEMQAMKTHADLGYRIITPGGGQVVEEANSLETIDSPLMKLAAKIAMSHHERWDGAGYPKGLASEDIPLEGRIVAVADVFDALSSDRPYKRAFPFERCVELIVEGRGSHFDPQIVDAFLSRLEEVATVYRMYQDCEVVGNVT